jgi:hypothetical protein
VQGTEEEARRGARVFDSDRAGIDGAAEVRLDDAQRAAGRGAVRLAIERQSDFGRPLVHVNRDDRRDDARQKRHQLRGEVLQDDPRILGARELFQLEDARRQLDAAALHRLEEELLLRFDVAQQRRRRDLQLSGDVGQRGGLESLLREDAACDREQFRPSDGCRASHL